MEPLKGIKVHLPVSYYPSIVPLFYVSTEFRPLAVRPDQLAGKKTSITLDLRDGSSRNACLRLLTAVDVLTDPFRSGVLKRRGPSLTEVLAKYSPHLIVARIT
ncbi:CoA-transferase family III [Penicillium camemberti]|uniref:CoA-transferase family III n=1 Tax=Penicillium camemberti (strain FM 013) TaxID=1429867 RepID=A0A0G4PDX0_PENC3|nr:CoA-transferase family III [Penicillium camemberti]